VAPMNLFAKFANRPGAPGPLFGHSGNVSTGLPELAVSMLKGGDSGSQNMQPDELVFMRMKISRFCQGGFK